jgi:two-component system sensor histidine kinase MprB
MSLRVKLVIGLVVLAAGATVALGVSSYLDTSRRLQRTIDRSLDEAALSIRRDRVGDPDGGLGLDRTPTPDRSRDRGRLPGGGERPRTFEQILVQVLDVSGKPIVVPGSGALPVDDRAMDVAAGRTEQWRDVVAVDRTRYRVLTLGTGGGAVQLARSLAETDDLLEGIRTRTAAAVAVVVVLAAGAGWLIARQVARRLERLTGAAEQVAQTGRLDVEVPVGGTDEAGRLGVAFNGMLHALAESKQAQRRLVHDAAHELRTPLTSLRANVAALRRFGRLDADEQSRVVRDLDEETRELSRLVNDLVESATEQAVDEPVTPVALEVLAERVAARARRRLGCEVVVDAEPVVVDARAGAIDRAMTNLVDNAAKFAGAAGPIELVVRGARVEVRDRGPGIAPDDLPKVFDRFHRSDAARALPGSGLGLSIVRDVAERHGGTVFAAARDGGGAVVGFELPAHPVDAAGIPASAGGT